MLKNSDGTKIVPFEVDILPLAGPCDSLGDWLIYPAHTRSTVDGRLLVRTRTAKLKIRSQSGSGGIVAESTPSVAESTPSLAESTPSLPSLLLILVTSLRGQHEL